jgi:hypothetical protein
LEFWALGNDTLLFLVEIVLLVEIIAQILEILVLTSLGNDVCAKRQEGKDLDMFNIKIPEAELTIK